MDRNKLLRSFRFGGSLLSWPLSSEVACLAEYHEKAGVEMTIPLQKPVEGPYKPDQKLVNEAMSCIAQLIPDAYRKYGRSWTIQSSI